MSKLSDVFDFESFHTKDIFKKIKQDPERLLLGGFGTDPWSAKALNWATGSNYEPLVDQMGGAYGGHTFSMFGNKDGGVYKRAQDAGIDTKSGGRMQDAAHIVAGIYGANGLMGIGGAPAGGVPASSGATGGASGGTASGLGSAATNGAVGGALPEIVVTGSAGGSGGMAPAAIGGAAGGASTGGNNWMDQVNKYRKYMPQQNKQQQQQAQPQPIYRDWTLSPQEQYQQMLAASLARKY